MDNEPNIDLRPQIKEVAIRLAGYRWCSSVLDAATIAGSIDPPRITLRKALADLEQSVIAEYEKVAGIPQPHINQRQNAPRYYAPLLHGNLPCTKEEDS